MVKRQHWVSLIEAQWRHRSVLWLRGVRRTGKTCLAQSLSAVEYFDCELPRVRQAMDDPEAFLQKLRGKRIALDEVHRLPNPSELLKIAADHFPDIQVLATGSSSLGISSRFRDTLTGRKTDLWLTPMIEADRADFQWVELNDRLLRGGLPPFFLAAEIAERDYQEWLDSYWAKDVQELFRLERRVSFQRFVEMLWMQSGGIFEATKFAVPCEVSRSTITNYLAVLEATAVVLVLRPFSSRKTNEIIAAPKVYGFDTGFVCVFRGWSQLRPDDLDRMWEHYVLNELTAHLQGMNLRYWRDKQGHEVDFIWQPRGREPVAIECKWSSRDFDAASLLAFSRAYPEFALVVVSTDAQPAYSKNFNGTEVHFVTLQGLLNRMSGG